MMMGEKSKPCVMSILLIMHFDCDRLIMGEIWYLIVECFLFCFVECEGRRKCQVSRFNMCFWFKKKCLIMLC